MQNYSRELQNTYNLVSLLPLTFSYVPTLFILINSYVNSLLDFLCEQFVSWQATVLEEMPAFPERESSILAVLKKKKPGRVPENEIREGRSPNPAPTTNHTEAISHSKPSAVSANASADLLGLSTPPASQPAAPSNTGMLVDVLGDMYGGQQQSQQNNSFAAAQSYNTKK